MKKNAERFLVAGLVATFVTLCSCEAEMPLYVVVIATAVSMICLGRFMDYREEEMDGSEFVAEDEEWYDRNYNSGHYIPRHLAEKRPGQHER